MSVFRYSIEFYILYYNLYTIFVMTRRRNKNKCSSREKRKIQLLTKSEHLIFETRVLGASIIHNNTSTTYLRMYVQRPKLLLLYAIIISVDT